MYDVKFSELISHLLVSLELLSKIFEATTGGLLQPVIAGNEASCERPGYVTWPQVTWPWEAWLKD